MTNSMDSKIEELSKRIEKLEKNNLKYQLIRLVAVLLISLLMKYFAM